MQGLFCCMGPQKLPLECALLVRLLKIAQNQAGPAKIWVSFLCALSSCVWVPIIFEKYANLCVPFCLCFFLRGHMCMGTRCHGGSFTCITNSEC